VNGHNTGSNHTEFGRPPYVDDYQKVLLLTTSINGMCCIMNSIIWSRLMAASRSRQLVCSKQQQLARVETQGVTQNSSFFLRQYHLKWQIIFWTKKYFYYSSKNLVSDDSMLTLTEGSTCPSYTSLTEAAPSADKKSLFKEKSTIIVCTCLKMLLDTS
jgi:hypothetical protein